MNSRGNGERHGETDPLKTAKMTNGTEGLGEQAKDSSSSKHSSSPEDPGENGPVLFFDGECHLCQKTVQFVLKRERSAELRFASLQSSFARDRIPAQWLPPQSDSLVLWEEGQFYGKSQAVLRLCRYLRFPWRAGYVLRWFPRLIGDPVYDIVAKRRYRWFGKTRACALLEGMSAAQKRLIRDR